MDIFQGTLFFLLQTIKQFFRIHVEEDVTIFTVAKCFGSEMLKSDHLLSYVLIDCVSSKLFAT